METWNKKRVFSLASVKKRLDNGKIVSWKYSWNPSPSRRSMVVGGLTIHQKYKPQLHKYNTQQQVHDWMLERPHAPFSAASAPISVDIDGEQVSPNSFSYSYSNVSNNQEPKTGLNEDSPPPYSSIASAPRYQDIMLSDPLLDESLYNESQVVCNQRAGLNTITDLPPSYSVAMGLTDNTTGLMSSSPPPYFISNPSKSTFQQNQQNLIDKINQKIDLLKNRNLP